MTRTAQQGRKKGDPKTVQNLIEQLIAETDYNTIERLAHPSCRHLVLSLVGSAESQYLRGVNAKAKKLGIATRWATKRDTMTDGFYLFDKETAGSVWHISPCYDIDGIYSPDISCTAEAVYKILEKLEMRERHVCVIGRGHAVKGLLETLIANDYTVTVTHSKTKNTTNAAFPADVIVNSSQITPCSVGACIGSVVFDISGSLAECKYEKDVTYISSREIGRLNTSILLNRFVNR